MNMPLGMCILNREGLVPLRSVKIDARIRDMFCDVTVEQCYCNDEPGAIEAVYTFPLPLDAVLLGVDVTLGGKALRGTVLPKAGAERGYENAMAEGDAAIRLEKIEPGLYFMSVGNLNPGEDAVIRVRYGQLLRWNSNDVRFHVPTTLAPRYGLPQMAPYQVPPVSLTAENRFSFGLRVEGLLAAAAIDCPSHRLTTRRDGEAIEIALAQGAAAMDRDLVLNFNLAAGAHSSAVSVAHGDGRVALLSWRPEISTAPDSAPRAYKILVDCSGSMAGDSINQARVALARILDSLRPEDRFDIVRFGSTHEAIFGGLRPAAVAELGLARARVAFLAADMGGTEIGAALRAAYELRGEVTGVRPDVLLITDGQVHNAESIVEAARASGHRIFSVGVGAGVAEAFLRRLASETDGACELVSPNEDMAGRILRHFQRLSALRARSARILWPGTPSREAPAQVSAVYDGDTCHVFAWLPASATGEVRVRVELEDGRIVEQTVPVQPVAEDAEVGAPGHPIARLAAAAWVAEAKSRGEAQAIALEYQLLTEYTDFLMVHQRTEDKKASDIAALRPVANMLAAGWGGVGDLGALRVNMQYDIGEVSLHASYGGEPDLMFAELDVPSPFSGLSASTLYMLENSMKLDADAGRLLSLDMKKLRQAGVPDAILDCLQRFINRGHDEYQVVLAFLHVLANIPGELQFSREAKHIVATAAAKLKPAREVQAGIFEALAAEIGFDTAFESWVKEVERPAKGQ